MKYVHILKLINEAASIVIIQADNPDGDSLASALALESIIGSRGKKVSLYCGVDIPSYLRYMPGSDRVSSELPSDFQLSIIVDTAALSLLESLQKNNQLSRLKNHPCVVIDHHISESTIHFSQNIVQEPSISTGALIFELCEQWGWEITLNEAELLTYSILSDSLGFTSEAVNASTMKIMSVLLSKGVNLAKLDMKRRSMSRKTPDIVMYKGRLLQRIEFAANNRIATITIPWEEIELYSHAYNPSMLVIDEMRFVEGVYVAIAFKTYPDGKITAKIRSNFGIKIAHQIAEHFGGGGHPYAAGFKVTEATSFDDLKNKCIEYTMELLDTLPQQNDETIQHTF